MEEDFEDEELVGAEKEDKDWKGIVIALLVIGFILSMIIVAIVLVTPAKEKFEPGDPLTFSQLTDPSLQPKQPIFSFSSDGESYITMLHNETDKFISLVKFGDRSASPQLIVSSTLLRTELKDLVSVSLSPDGAYVLLKLKNSEQTHSEYRIYDVRNNRFVDDSNFKAGVKMDYAAWTSGQSLVILMQNSVMGQTSPTSNPHSLSADPQDGSLIALPNKLYQDITNMDKLLWVSPDGQRVAYARITPGQGRRKRQAEETTPFTFDVVSLYVAVSSAANSEEIISTQSQDNARLTYLTGVTWVSPTEVMVGWLDSLQTVATYLLCNVTTVECVKNLEYSSGDLQWIEAYQTPVFNTDTSEFYTILPDPADANRLYRHITAVKKDRSKRRSPEFTYLTHYQWSDSNILGYYDKHLFYTSTGSNFTHRHLYSYSIEDTEAKCLTCSIDLGTRCLYVDAEFSTNGKLVMISCLGPDIPSYHVLNVSSLLRGSVDSRQVDSTTTSAMKEALGGVKEPVIEYYNLQLESGFTATIKLHVPRILDRTKLYTYGLILMINDNLGAQQATQKYPDLLRTYMSKNQSYIIADVDLRGSANRGEKHRQSVYEGLGVKEAYDVQQIVSYIMDNQVHFKVNNTKIAIMGSGYGGFVGLHALKKGIAPCGIIVSPLTNVKNINKFERQRYMRDDSMKMKTTDLSYVCKRGEECLAPEHQNILVVHGTEDDHFDYSNSLDLMRKLQLAGYEFKQQIYPGVGHNIEKSPRYKHYYQTITNYLSDCFSGNMTHSPLINR